MDNTPSAERPPDGSNSRKNLRQTVFLALAMLAVPLFLGIVFVVVLHAIKPTATPPAATANEAVSAQEEQTDDLARLLALRRERRLAGRDTDELNIRIWAAQTHTPAELFRVPPPDAAHDWRWNVSQDGLFALAVSTSADAAGRRTVGLFDLIGERWVWTTSLPWPDAHEPPFVFGKRVVIRYAKNAACFAMEIGETGTILGIDALGKTAVPATPVTPTVAGYPGSPIAIRNGVYFASEAGTQELVGFALNKIPGLRFAGPCDAATAFSGNGFLKFSADRGFITVADSLTQTALQRVKAWPDTTNTTVTGTLATRDGSRLSVFLKTTFGGASAQEREWSVALATYSGTAQPSFNADALLANPRFRAQRQAASSDGRWILSVGLSNVLTVASQPSKRELARVDLGMLLGADRPIVRIAFLEDDRHVVLRQSDRAWLLDFDLVRGYADLLGRFDASAEASRAAATNDVTASASVPAVASAPSGLDQPLFAEEEDKTPAASALALKAERLVAHQAWFYAAATLDVCAAHSAFDGRAPRVNPLLLARAHILAGQPRKARLVCREALGKLIADPSDYNRMARYQLQGLLFAP